MKIMDCICVTVNMGHVKLIHMYSAKCLSSQIGPFTSRHFHLGHPVLFPLFILIEN